MKKLQVLQQVERHELNPLAVSPEALAERAVFHALPLGTPVVSSIVLYTDQCEKKTKFSSKSNDLLEQSYFRLIG